MKKGDRVYHFAFGYCVIIMISSISGRALIEIEKGLFYYSMGKGRIYLKPKETTFVPKDELFNSKEEVPDMFGLKLISLAVKFDD